MQFEQRWALFLFIGIFVAPVAAQNVLFSSDLTDSTNWGYSHFDGTDAPVAGLNTSTAQFDWDYSAYGIPEAPNSDSGDATTRGLRLTSNDVGFVGGDQLAVHYQDSRFTGQYTVQVDIWANWASNSGAGVGTTEHAGVFVGFDPNDVDFDFAPSKNGAGLLFDTDGDCSNCDYILLKDQFELDTFSGQYSVTDFGFGNQQGYDNTDANDVVDIPAAFPSIDIVAATNNLNGSGIQNAGAGGFQWMTVTVEVDTTATGNGTNGSLGTAKFSLKSASSGNTIVVGTVDNSVDDDPDDGIATGEQPVGMSGGIALVTTDFFNGSPNPFDLGFMVFDNVRVFDGHFTSAVDGDFNGDNVWDCSDIDALVAEIAAGTNSASFDMNGDGVVTSLDVLDVTTGWLTVAGANSTVTGGNPFLVGDASLDGFVDVTDFGRWSANALSADAGWCQGDFTADGFVDVSDYAAWSANKFRSSVPSLVPEPSGLALCYAAGLFLALFRRRR